MVYIISGLIIAICIAVIIFGLRVFRENRELKDELKKKQDDDDKVRF